MYLHAAPRARKGPNEEPRFCPALALIFEQRVIELMFNLISPGFGPEYLQSLPSTAVQELGGTIPVYSTRASILFLLSNLSIKNAA